MPEEYVNDLFDLDDDDNLLVSLFFSSVVSR